MKRNMVRDSGLAREGRTGDGWLSHLKAFAQATDSAQTIGVAAILGGLYVRTGLSTARTDTTDTAVNILAALPCMDIGDTFLLAVNNVGAGTLTVAGGTGVTVSGTATVATTTTRFFLFTKTSATAMTCLGL